MEDSVEAFRCKMSLMWTLSEEWMAQRTEVVMDLDLSHPGGWEKVGVYCCLLGCFVLSCLFPLPFF